MAQPKLTLSEAAPPARLGRYLLGRELGRGFSSVVYEATDTLRGRRVALKVLTFLQNLSPARRQDLAGRFEREARAISTLAHPSIVAIYEVGHAEDGRQFIAMEHLEGETLRARLGRTGPLPVAEALPLIIQIADALQYAHGRGVIHRDVKPDNVFVCPDGTAKLMDFGVAHVFADDGLTQTGTVVGSPAYMSPEQINGRLLDGRSDVFSLAITLAEALTGRKPFEAPNIPAVMNQILHRPPQLAGISSRPLRKALERALAKNPQARTPSPAAFAEALRRVAPSLLHTAGGLAAATQSTTVMPLPLALSPRPARRASWDMVGLSAIALGLAALAALPFALGRHPHRQAGVLAAPSAREGRAYHISSEWRRASGGPPPRHHARRRHAAFAAAPARLREGEGRVTETYTPAAPVMPDGRDVLRALRSTPRAVPATVAARPPFRPRPPFAPLPPRQPLPPRAPAVPAPVRVATLSAPAVSPVVRTGDFQQERRPPAPVPPPAASTTMDSGPPPAPAVGYPYGTGEGRLDDSGAPRDPDIADSAPRLVHRTPPLYPPSARERGEQGTVRLRVLVTDDGEVDGATVTQSSGSPALDAAAIATVLHWEYEPAFHDGRAVPAPAHAEVRFSLD